MSKSKKGAATHAARKPARPQSGGSYIRHPDGSLERTAGTERPEPFSAPPAEQPQGQPGGDLAPGEPDTQNDAGAGDQKQEA